MGLGKSDRVSDCLFLRAMNKALLIALFRIFTGSLTETEALRLSDHSEFIQTAISETMAESVCAQWSISADSGHVSVDSDESPDMLSQSWLSSHYLLSIG